MELIAIVGPTASGKTHKAVALAKRIGGEIISADSRQLYRGMDIGTGKDLEEYGTVPYHLIDICPAGYKYNLYEYLRDCDKAVAEIRHRGNHPKKRRIPLEIPFFIKENPVQDRHHRNHIVKQHIREQQCSLHLKSAR